FTLYTSDFTYNTEACHIQKFSDASAVVGCMRDGQEGEYRSLVDNFVQWCRHNHLQLNTTKTKEMVVDFRRSQPPLLPVSIGGVSVEVVNTYKYLGVHLDSKLDWSANIDAIFKKGQSRLYFLRRLRSFNVCNKLLRMFYQSVFASVLFYAVVCWGGSIKQRDAGRLDRLVGRGGADRESTRLYSTRRSPDLAHVRPVCYCQRPLLCCGVLGRQHKEEGCRATGQAGEEGGSCCWQCTGLPHLHGEREYAAICGASFAP